jgi:ankyrin repeat protein
MVLEIKDIKTESEFISAIEDVPDVNIILEDGWNLLMYAVFREYNNAVNILIDKNVEVSFCSDSDGLTPLHLAVMNEDFSIVSTLIENSMVAKNEKDLENGWTPLHHACASGNWDIIGILVYAKVNAKIYDNNRALPLSYATEHYHNDEISENSEIYFDLIKMSNKTLFSRDKSEDSLDFNSKSKAFIDAPIDEIPISNMDETLELISMIL